MTGVIVNSVSIVLGTLIGVIIKKRFNSKYAERMELALGLSVSIVGIKMALQYNDMFVLIGCLLVGGIIGTALELEKKISQLANKMKALFKGKEDSAFSEGFAVSSILFCTGAMAVVGAIDSAVKANHDVLFTKSLLDGVISITFGAIYGIGVAFSAITVFLYEGLIALVSSKVSFLTNPKVLNDISGVGGCLLLMIAFSQMRIRKMPVGDFLPAIILVIIVSAFIY